MPVYHIVLGKVKPDVANEQIEEIKKRAQEMVGQIPGLSKVDLNSPFPGTASRGKGYNIGVVALLDKPETVKVYADHPAHKRVTEVLLPVLDDILAYDLVYDHE